MAETPVPSAQLLGLSLRNSDWLTANSPLQRFSASASFTAKELALVHAIGPSLER
jgi:hypothetical protein